MLRKVLLWFVGTCLLFVASVGAGYAYLLAWSDMPVAASNEVRIELVPGDVLSSVAHRLRTMDYLSDTNRLVLLGRLTGADKRLHIGEYRFTPELTPNQLLTKLTKGDVIRYQFRIAEGISVRQLLAELASTSSLQHELLAADATELQQELNLDTGFTEGMFYPDTYEYVKGHTDKSILLRANVVMQKEIARAWQDRLPTVAIGSAKELLILASIIEKETGQAEDRGLISQVFHKRLSKNMRLQTDPSVIYALGEKFDGNLTRAHLKVDSPFNTYRYAGLPPTPIAIPSRASLQAAAQPAVGEFLYFVAKGNGASKFSRTLAEHNAAVRKFQLGQEG